jgi:putative membrane protein
MQATDHLHPHDREHEHPHHRAPLQDWLKTALLIGLGLYFVYIIASGSLANYINARFAWLSYVAAAIFLLFGAASSYRLLRGHDHTHHPHEHDHQHATISWAVLAVIAVPLVLGTLIPSRPLGAAAVDGDLSASSLGGDSAAAFTIPPEQRNILDWVRAFNASDDLAAFSGLPVDVVGFVYRAADYPDDMFLVARFTISCCVADSVAIGLPVAWAEALPVDTWVRVQGQFVPGELRGELRSVVQPASVEVVPQPEHPYLYP